jgi:hypothetical protein
MAKRAAGSPAVSAEVRRKMRAGLDAHEAKAQVIEEWLEERFGGNWSWSGGSDITAAATIPDSGTFAQFKRNESGRWVLTGLLLLEDALTADRLRRVPVVELENRWSEHHDRGAVEAELEALPALRRTDDMSPEDFSRLVADHYRIWARFSPHPASAIADEWAVKVPTVHTWIREARLRGFLPPAQRGKGKAR